MPAPPQTLRSLTLGVGRFFGVLERATQEPATTAVVADYFSAISWDEQRESTALRTLAENLSERYAHAEDLLHDLFMAAYLGLPQLRDPAQMDPSRLLNRQIIAGILDTPEFTALRRTSVGDPEGSALAVLACARKLHDMLEQSRTAAARAKEHAEARRTLETAAAKLAAALQAAAEAADPTGTVPAARARAVLKALENAERAEESDGEAERMAAAALEQIAPTLRKLARAALADAVNQAQHHAVLMSAWGVEAGVLRRMDFDQRRELAGRLANGRMGKFAAMIGRFRMEASGQRANRIEYGASEVVGITLGDDVTRAIPAELAMLGHPAGRAVFAAKLAESRLMSYEQRGEMPTGRGAIIVLIDCSGSMTWPQLAGISGELWGKACGLALLDQARAATPKRDFVGILFSDAGSVSIHRFPAGQPVDLGALLDFAEDFFNGGTDFQAPLDEAISILQAEFDAAGRARGDLVLISDGECDVTEEWERTYRQRKERLGFRLFAVAVTHGIGPTLRKLADNARTIGDLTGPGPVADLFRVI